MNRFCFCEYFGLILMVFLYWFLGGKGLYLERKWVEESIGVVYNGGGGGSLLMLFVLEKRESILLGGHGVQGFFCVYFTFPQCILICRS